MTFEEMKRQADTLPNMELQRYAAVSNMEKENVPWAGDGYRCMACFCCAAWAVLRERRDGTAVEK